MEEQAHDRIEAGPKPKHQQLRELLIAMVVPGQAIPSERDLMATHGVSRATVRRAIDGLVADAVDDDRTDPASPTARRLSDRPPRWDVATPAAPPPAESASPPPVSLSLSPTSFDGTAPGTTSEIGRAHV